MMTALLLSLSLYQANPARTGQTNEDIVRACIQECHADAQRPDWQLKACVSKCLELGTK